MRDFIRFMSVWGGYMAFSAAGFAFLLWLISLDDDPNDEKAAYSLLWSMYWPIRWLYSRLVREDAAVEGPHQTLPKSASFRTIREAKDFLACSIAGQAELDGNPLTEIERKMLYFTETGWTLPDMKEVSAEFDRKYDQEEYERRIGELINQIQLRLADQGQQDRERWDAALNKLSQGDHYLSVLANGVSRPRRGLKHNLKLLLIALGFLLFAALDMYFRRWMRDH